MIDKASAIQGTSPLMHVRPPAAAPRMEAPAQPQEKVELGGSDAPPPTLRPSLAAAEKPTQNVESLASLGRKIGMGAALGVSGLAGMMAVASPAQAQVRVATTTPGGPVTLAQALRSSQPQRDTTPVRVSRVQDVVQNFSAQRQIYVVGDPQYQGHSFSADDMRQFQQVAKDHPNAYIVLVAQSSDMKADDYGLSRGVGNSAEFTSVRDEATGQKNGQIVMVYFKVTDSDFVNRTGKDRAIYMRSEQLLDDAGVGEDRFMDRDTGVPRELMQTYIDNVQSRGVPGALDAVFDRVDRGVATYVQKTVEGANSQVRSASDTFKTVSGQAREFVSKHGARGELGTPNLAGWQNRLEQAQQKLAAHDFAGAAQLAGGVTAEMTSYSNAVAHYQDAPGVATAAGTSLNSVEQSLTGLPDNASTRKAAQHLAEGRAELAQYQTSYSANNRDYTTHLERAQQLATQAGQEVSAAREHEQTVKNVKLYGSAAVGGALLITALALNARARKAKGEANAELDKQLQKMGDHSKELIDVLNSADPKEISQYAGTTQKLANQLIAGTANALTLLGGGEKFVAEARDMIRGRTVGERLKNMFLTGNFEQAVDLLTRKDQKLSFDLGDSKRAELPAGSHAAEWRDQLLASVVAKPMELNLNKIFDQLGQQTTANAGDIKTLADKRDQVASYLDTVKGQAEGVQGRSSTLQEQGKEDSLFIAPSVTRRLMPTVLGDQSQPGLIKKGHELQVSDPLRAWEEFGDQAQRLTTEGGQIVDVGSEARQNLLPALATADESLHSHGVATAWAHSRKDELSLALDRTGERGVTASVAADVAGIKKEIAELQSRVETTVLQDKERVNVSPGLISDAESDVETARQGISEALKAAGVFANGTPDQVLRESDRDPSTLTQKSHADLQATKPELDQGNIENAGALLGKVRTQTASAHDLVKQSRDALASYTSTAEERRTRREHILESIPATYSSSLGRIQSTYNAAAQATVAKEVSSAANSSAPTVADYLKLAQGQLETSGSLNSQAQGNYERANLLTSRDQLADSDRQLKTSQANLDAITTSEAALGQHQKEAQAELEALGGRISNTAGKLGNVYVRGKAKTLSAQAGNDLTGAKAAVMATPKDPYAAKQKLAAVENVRLQAESAIDSDHRAYDTARSAISTATSAIRSSNSVIDNVARQSWSTYISDYGSVSHSVSESDVSGARSTLRSAQSLLNEAEAKLSSQDYEGAASDASGADSRADNAASQARSVESRERSVYDGMVAAGEAVAARKRREREEAAQQAAQHNSSSSGGGGSWGGGGGSSGSTGGGW